MNKFIYIVIVAVCAIMSSCSKTAPNLFGTIPSIYENRIFKIAQKARQANEKDGMGAGTPIIMQEAPLAYDSASVEAQPQADRLKGSEVNATVGDGLSYTLASKVRITDVSLPVFSFSHSEPEIVTLEFDINNANKVNRVYYLLCNENDIIDCGFTDNITLQKGMKHVVAVLKAPNIPAVYQERINTFRIVSEDIYGRVKLDNDDAQKHWRAEYNDRLLGRESALPVK